MEGDFIRINKWLLPLSWLYGLGVRLRNTLFDIGVLKSESFDVPVISVGNITVGGTGKTPHVEYLIGLLRDKCRVAVLSRGYKRKSRGFVLADAGATARTVGDEPWQMKHKFPDVTVAVDADRRHGIRRLMERGGDGAADVVLLDDAFQHRYVKPGVNILLVDYHRLIVYDRLLPAGRLREHLAEVLRSPRHQPDFKPLGGQQFRFLKIARLVIPVHEDDVARKPGAAGPGSGPVGVIISAFAAAGAVFSPHEHILPDHHAQPVFPAVVMKAHDMLPEQFLG